MQRFIGYGKIPQFKDVVKDITFAAQYTHYDEVEEHPVLDKSAELPTLTCTGTEKIHGTNAAVCYSNPDGLWVQSRNKIITPGDDNNGCAVAIQGPSGNEVSWLAIIHMLATEHSIDLDSNVISIYFEWAGGNIQKNSALTGTPKCAIIFAHFKVSPLEPVLGEGSEELDYSLLPVKDVSLPDAGIYCITDYPTVSIDINFNEPLMSQNKMIEMVDIIEKQSLVGKAFGHDDNIGEGYVFTTEYKGKSYRFKVKGEEHSKNTGNVITLKPVDEAFEKVKTDFVNEVACISWRMEQMYNETKAENGDVTSAHTGIYLQKMFADINKEEAGTMEELGINPKSINGLVAKKAKAYFNSRAF